MLTRESGRSQYMSRVLQALQSHKSQNIRNRNCRPPRYSIKLVKSVLEITEERLRLAQMVLLVTLGFGGLPNCHTGCEIALVGTVFTSSPELRGIDNTITMLRTDHATGVGDILSHRIHCKTCLPALVQAPEAHSQRHCTPNPRAVP